MAVILLLPTMLRAAVSLCIRPCYNGVIVLDPADQAFVEALLTLATNVAEELPGLEKHRLGLCDTLTKVFYIIRSVRSAKITSLSRSGALRQSQFYVGLFH